MTPTPQERFAVLAAAEQRLSLPEHRDERERRLREGKRMANQKELASVRMAYVRQKNEREDMEKKRPGRKS